MDLSAWPTETYNFRSTYVALLAFSKENNPFPATVLSGGCSQQPNFVGFTAKTPCRGEAGSQESRIPGEQGLVATLASMALQRPLWPENWGHGHTRGQHVKTWRYCWSLGKSRKTTKFWLLFFCWKDHPVGDTSWSSSQSNHLCWPCTRARRDQEHKFLFCKLQYQNTFKYYYFCMPFGAIINGLYIQTFPLHFIKHRVTCLNELFCNGWH